MPTFLQLLTALAEETGEYVGLTTTSLGTTSTLICSTLVNSNLEATELEDVAVLITSGNNAGEQRFVRRAGLSDSTGTITTADTFTNAVASGVSFSLFARMPALTRLTGPSYQKALNMTHRRAWVEDNISFTGETGKKHYDIDTTTYSWWTEASRIIAVYHPRVNADDELRMLGANEWYWNWDGSVRQLVLPSAPWNTGETGTVKVYRPANSILRQSGTWTDQASQTAGLSALADESLMDVNDAVVLGSYFVYKQLHTLNHPGQETSEWMVKAREAARVAANLSCLSPRPNRLTGIPNLRPTYSGSRGYQ